MSIITICMVTEQKQGQVIYALIALTQKQTNSSIYFGECATDEPLPENASQTTSFLLKVYLCGYRSTVQCLTSYGCTITIMYYNMRHTSMEYGNEVDLSYTIYSCHQSGMYCLLLHHQHRWWCRESASRRHYNLLSSSELC